MTNQLNGLSLESATILIEALEAYKLNSDDWTTIGYLLGQLYSIREYLSKE
jgi:hypothetical protein